MEGDLAMLILLRAARVEAPHGAHNKLSLRAYKQWNLVVESAIYQIAICVAGVKESLLNAMALVANLMANITNKASKVRSRILCVCFRAGTASASLANSFGQCTGHNAIEINDASGFPFFCTLAIILFPFMNVGAS